MKVFLKLLLCVSICVGCSVASCADLFTVTSRGDSGNVDVTICLDARSRISCQKYSVNSLLLSIRTNVPNRLYNYVGLKVNSSGYKLGKIGSDCRLLNNGFCMFSVNNVTAKSLIIATRSSLPILPVTLDTGIQNVAYSTTVSASLGVAPYTYTISAGSLPTGLTLNSSSGAISGTPTADGTSTFTVLATDSDGNTGTKQYTLEIDAANFAYIAQAFGSSDGVYICDVHPVTKLLSNCSITGSGFDAPVQIAPNPAKTFAYIANYLGNSVSVCDIHSTTRALSNCTPTGSGFARPIGMVVSPNGSFVYVGSSSGNYISVCNVGGSGLLTGCTPTGSGFGRPFGVVITSAGDRLYVADIIGNVVMCDADSSTGLLSGCSQAATGLGSLRGMGLSANNAFAYLAKGPNEMLLCAVANGTGILENCNVTTSFAFDFDAAEIGILSRNIYIPLFFGNSVLKCTSHPVTGVLSDCVDSGATGLESPEAVTII